MNHALRSAGYDPRCTPIDTLMAAPAGVGLTVAEAMGEYDDTDDEGDPLAGFQVRELQFMEVEVFSDLEGTQLVDTGCAEFYPEEYPA